MGKYKLKFSFVAINLYSILFNIILFMVLGVNHNRQSTDYILVLLAIFSLVYFVHLYFVQYYVDAQCITYKNLIKTVIIPWDKVETLRYSQYKNNKIGLTVSSGKKQIVISSAVKDGSNLIKQIIYNVENLPVDN